MKQTNSLSLSLFIFLTVQVACGFSQTFTAVFHEIADFHDVNEIIHGDFDSDGNIDYIAVNNFNGQMSVGIGNGIEAPTFTTIEEGLNVFGLEAIDFDADGDLDFVGSAPFEDASFVWLNDGAANFVRETLNITDYDAIHFADLNNDGNINIVVGSGDRISIYDLFDRSLILNMIIFEDVFAGSSGAITTLDYDMDGDLDIAVVFGFDGLLLFRQGEGFNFAEENLFSETFNDNDLHFAQLNDDGIFDFIVQSDFERRSSILLSNASSEYEEIDIPRMFNANFHTDVADFDNDERVEIIHLDGDNPIDKALSIFNFDEATSELTQTVLAEDHSDTEDGGIVDIDGDGDLDFYLYTNDFFDDGLVFYLQDDITSSIHEIGNTRFNIYPNPAVDFINIDIDGSLDFQVNIYNVNGKLIKSCFNESEIKVGSMPTGTYLVEIKDINSRQKIVERIVIGK